MATQLISMLESGKQGFDDEPDGIVGDARHVQSADAYTDPS